MAHQPIAAGSIYWRITGYKNGALAGEGATTPAFPFNDPSGVAWAGNPAFPLIGRRGGYSTGHDVVVHTAGLARITQHDNVQAYLAAEYARNAPLLAA